MQGSQPQSEDFRQPETFLRAPVTGYCHLSPQAQEVMCLATPIPLRRTSPKTGFRASRFLESLELLVVWTSYFRSFRSLSRFTLPCASPSAAALRYHLKASTESLATPNPFSYIHPRLFCPPAFPCSAALRNHWTAWS